MTVQHWKRKPRPADRDGGLVTARYDPSLSGQDYRAMMGDLGTVATLAGVVGGEPLITEATFEDAAGVRSQVLLVRYWWYPEDGPARQDYVIVHPGNYLAGHPYDDHLGEADDADLAQFYDREETPRAAR